MSDQKSATIEPIANGFMVELWTPRTNKDSFGVENKHYAPDLDTAFELVRGFLGTTEA